MSPALAEDSILLSHQIYVQLIHFAVHLKLTQYCKPTIDVKSLSCVQLFAAPWTVAYQAPPSMEFSKQEYLSGLPFPSPEDLPKAGIKPRSPAL